MPIVVAPRLEKLGQYYQEFQSATSYLGIHFNNQRNGAGLNRNIR
jgi:hypothetical protein